MKLPNEILNAYKQWKQSDSPSVSLRALTDINGNLGETYLLSDPNSICFFSGKLGEEYEKSEVNFAEIRKLDTETERPFAYLTIQTADHEIRLKLAAYDLDVVENLKEIWKTSSTSSGKDGVASFSEITPLLGFCAALHALVHVDDVAMEEEMKNLSVVIGDSALFRQGLACWEQYGTDVLVDKLKPLLSPEQKLCLLTNMLEIAMVDGVLHKKEKEFIEHTRECLSVDIDRFNQIFDVLLVKNNLSIF